MISAVQILRGAGKLFTLLVAVSCVVDPFSPVIAQTQEEPGAWKELSHFTRQSWQKKQGLPQNSVHAITQTRDGYLWLGTEEGLVRFDGLHLRVFDNRNIKALRKRFITSLLERSDGSLWVGTSGGGVTVHQSGNWTHLPLGRDDIVNKIYEDIRGNIWVASRKGLSFLRDSVFSYVALDDTISAWGVNTIADDARGSIFLGTRAGLFTVTGRQFESVQRKQIELKRITTSIRSHDGSLWIGTNGDGVFHINGTGSRHFSVNDGLPSNIITALFEDKIGSLWIGTPGSGFCKIYEGKVLALSHADPLSTEFVHAIFEDSEGNIWIGTAANGMYRLSTAACTTFESGSTPGERMIRTVYQDHDGNLWAGNEAGALLRWNTKRFAQIMRFPPRHDHQIRALTVDHNGSLWIGATTGLYLYDKGKLRKPFPEITAVSALYVDSKNCLWVGSSGGLIGLRSPRLAKKANNWDLNGILVRFIREDAMGGLWISTSAGLTYSRNGVFKQYTIDDGLKSNQLTSIHIDSDGVVWAGSIGGGLSRIRNGQVSTFTVDDGLFDDTVYEILEDDHKTLWMSCNNGVFKVRKSELDAFADGKIAAIISQPFGESDGMISSECNGATQPAACKTSDGRMWFATTAGVVMVDPNNLRIYSAPPPVVIEKMLAGNREMNLQTPVWVPADRRDIQLDFTAMSFVAPERVRFRYRLEGYDKDWVDAGSRRSAFYNNLDPGTYRFRVTASNSDGRWNDLEASFTFDLDPHYYETTWFLVLCIVALAGTVGRGFQLYKRYQQRKLVASELETQLTKSQLHALRLQLQPHFLFNTLNAISGTILVSRNKSIKMIAKLSEILRHNLDSDASQTVPLRTELRLLKLYLDIEKERFGKRLSVHIDVAHDTLDASVPSFILQPLVENAIHHGMSGNVRPGIVTITSKRLGPRLELAVKDSGAASDRGKLPPFKDGIGLSNTRSRLRHLYGNGGDLDLQPNESGGMTSTILIPYMNGSVRR